MIDASAIAYTNTYQSNRSDNDTGTCIPPECYSDPANRKFIVNCADNLFKIKAFVAQCEKMDQHPITALLPSDLYDLKSFKADLWKPFQDSFLRKHEARVVGTIERYVEGNRVGCLHAHLLIQFPAEYAPEYVKGPLNRELGRVWGRYHEKAPPKDGMALVEPYDSKGECFGRYIAKAFNRGICRAKWGAEGNQSFLLTHGGVKDLWKRDELPSRWSRRVSGDPVVWFQSEMAMGATSATSCHGMLHEPQESSTLTSGDAMDFATPHRGSIRPEGMRN